MTDHPADVWLATSCCVNVADGGDMCVTVVLQCFDAVDWAAGSSSGL